MQEYDSKEPEPVAPGVQEKRCSGPCGQLLPTEAFCRHKKAKDGLNWWCKECAREQARVYYAAHNDELKARARACRVVVTHKRCCACDAVLPVARFQRTERTRDGYQTWCKACRKAYDLAHKAEKAEYDAAYRLANAAHIARMGAAYRAANRERVRESKKRYHRANAPAIIARTIAWIKANPERFAANMRRCQATHPEWRRACALNRRVRMAAAGGTIHARDLRLLRAAQRSRCAYCGVLIGRGYHVDHMTPVSKGGSSDLANLCLACARCNLKKATRLAGEWLALLLRADRNQAAV